MNEYNEMTDDTLATKYMNGDARAFDTLLSRYKKGMFAFLMYHCNGDEDKANDLFQDLFIKVIISLREGKYQPKGRFSFWLTRIAHNMVQDRLRSRQNCPVVEIGNNNDLSLIQGADIIEYPCDVEIIESQTRHNVMEMMNNLPEEQRYIIDQRYFQGLSFKEIAQSSGMSINTALGRVRYAHINLRKMAKKKMELSLI
ncbi:MAG: sigma-70 family RNA polymerase sigma factor [Prevotella sp.]|nr:sigma-70 family RNA polymerase sigma factor [Prevotella sp.]